MYIIKFQTTDRMIKIVLLFLIMELIVCTLRSCFMADEVYFPKPKHKPGGENWQILREGWQKLVEEEWPELSSSEDVATSEDAASNTSENGNEMCESLTSQVRSVRQTFRLSSHECRSERVLLQG